MHLKNLIAATYTPLQQDFRINLSAVKTYATFLKRNQVAGAFVNGSTADFVSLSTEERKLIIDAWSKDKPSDFYLINHVGHNNLREAIALTEHCADKVDAIAALAPFYFKLNSLEQLLEYCKQIALAAPKLPFYYYHIPVLTGANFKMHDFLKIATKEIPNFSGIKFSKNDLIDFKFCLNYNNSSSNILFGVDELYLSSLPLGAAGWVGSTYNHLAPLYHKIKEAFENKNNILAGELQGKAMRFVELLDQYGGYNGVAKGLMKTLGVDCGPSRFPHSSLNMQRYQQITEALEKEGIFQYTSR
jgi:N-acetylneuraminate lyase